MPINTYEIQIMLEDADTKSLRVANYLYERTKNRFTVV